MAPYYEKNNYVAGSKVEGSKIEGLAGLNCIVETMDGSIFVRRLEKGTRKDRYMLLCLNTTEGIKNLLLTDVELRSAAEVVWYRKRSSLRSQQ